jgi:hypothetical protein
MPPLRGCAIGVVAFRPMPMCGICAFTGRVRREHNPLVPNVFGSMAAEKNRRSADARYRLYDYELYFSVRPQCDI